MNDNENSWTQWWDQHAPALLMFARTWTSTLRDAEDALQDGFVRFYRNRASARNPLAYLYACVKLAALDIRRGENRRHQREQRVAAESEAVFQAEPLCDASEQHRRNEIERAIAELPNDQQQTVVLKIWGGLTFTQIGDVLSISANTAASRYRYALNKLGQTLSAELLS